MSIPDIHPRLPYGRAFLFVDRVVSCSPDGEIITEKTFSSTDPILEAHFERGPTIVPGVLLVEMASQSALLAALITGKLAAESRLLIGSIQARFFNQASGGCVVRARVSVDDPAGGFAFKAELDTDGTIIARVQGIGIEIPEPDVHCGK